MLRYGDWLMTKIRMSALLGCSHCGMWSGWVSKRYDPNTQNPPKSINTICSVCSGRLRHKIGMRDKDRQYTHCYTTGRGAHNRSTSVFKFVRWYEPSTCKSEAARINRKIQENRRKGHERKRFKKRPDGWTKASEY